MSLRDTGCISETRPVPIPSMPLRKASRTRQRISQDKSLVHKGAKLMSISIFTRISGYVRNDPIGVWLVSTLVVVLALPAWAGSKSKDEDTLRNAANTLQQMLKDQNIPSDVIAKAECIIVLPDVKKFALGIGGSGGRGPMLCRNSSTGKWSAPAMYSVGGTSAGLQIGGSSSDFVLLVMDQKG